MYLLLFYLETTTIDNIKVNYNITVYNDNNIIITVDVK